MRSALCGHRSQNVISELDGLARDLNEVCSTLEYAVFVPLDAVVVGSVAQSCLTLCDPMDCSTPGFPLLHHFPELAQTHVH